MSMSWGDDERSLCDGDAFPLDCKYHCQCPCERRPLQRAKAHLHVLVILRLALRLESSELMRLLFRSPARRMRAFAG